MSENIEIDVDDEMLGALKSIARNRLSDIADDCSMELFLEEEISDTDDLEAMCGKVVLNSIFIAAIEASIVNTDLEDIT